MRKNSTNRLTKPRGKSKRHFSDETLLALRASKGLRIRVGRGRHRFIGIWHVVVSNRVFVRSWSAKPKGWYRTFVKEPYGTVQVGDYVIAVGARPVRDQQMRNAIDRAYLEKYSTPGALRYAKDLGSAKSQATTMELLPLAIRRHK